MKQGLQSDNIFQKILQLLYIIFFIGLAFAFHFLSSVSIGLILVTGVLKNKTEHKPLFPSNAKNLFLIACTLFYLLQFISLLYTENKQETLNQLRIKSELVFVPLALCISDPLNLVTKKKLINLFCLILFIAALYCLAADCLDYFQHHDTSVFFYHALVSPLRQHAVFFSIYIFIALLYLIENAGKKDPIAIGFIFKRGFHIFLILFFSVLIYILSSKLVISFYLVYLFYYATRFFVQQKKKRVTAITLLLSSLLAVILLFSTRNPVSKRFSEILNTDISLVKQDKYNPGIYFNDVQLRMVEWKFVREILNENHSWWMGMSPGDAQNFLDKKYIEKDMYAGDQMKKDNGYLKYDTHNQALESLLQSGIVGVLFFLLILFALIHMAWKKRNLLFRFTIVLLIAFSLIESAFQTQYALMLFTFFPLFLYGDEKQE